MAWPSSDVTTTNSDAGGDNPQVARENILDLMQKFNLLRNHFSTFMRGFVEAVDAAAARLALGASTVGSNVFTAADAAAARTALGATTVGGNVFTAADAAAARTVIGAADSAATVNLTGAQTVAGLKTFSGGHLSTNATQPIGYGVGAGAEVTQITSKGTEVVVTRPTGRIFTHNASLAAGASVSFIVTFSGNTSRAILIANTASTDYRVETFSVTATFHSIKLTNTSAGALAVSVGLNYAFIQIAIT
jgi:hypothetical protein